MKIDWGEPHALLISSLAFHKMGVLYVVVDFVDFMTTIALSIKLVLLWDVRIQGGMKQNRGTFCSILTRILSIFELIWGEMGPNWVFSTANPFKCQSRTG